MIEYLRANTTTATPRRSDNHRHAIAKADRAVAIGARPRAKSVLFQYQEKEIQTRTVMKIIRTLWCLRIMVIMGVWQVGVANLQAISKMQSKYIVPSSEKNSEPRDPGVKSETQD